MEIQYNVIVSLIPIFYDSRYSQIEPDYVKILLDDNSKVLTKKIGVLHKDITNCLGELFNEYIKVDYEWPEKTLISTRKNKKTIEITYLTKMQYIRDCNKSGKFIKISDFPQTVMDEYYVECISSCPNKFR